MPAKRPHIFVDGVEGKICGTCGEWNELSCYWNNGKRLSSMCKVCQTASRKLYGQTHREQIYLANKKYVDENREYVSEWNKKYREDKRDEIAEQRKEYRKNNIEKVSTQQKSSRAKRRGYYIQLASQSRRIRKQNDPAYRATENVKRNFQRLVKDSLRGSKSKKIREYLGIDFASFKVYIESQFTPEMSWGNYGTYWHIDHIIPCRAFDLTNEDDRKRCYHYSNLRPFEAVPNLSKQDKLPNGQRARDVIKFQRPSTDAAIPSNLTLKQGKLL